MSEPKAITDILELLPHKYPFLLVDKIIDYEPFEHLKALKNVTINEPFFQGHFPGNPIMPGVLILEALAQAGCLLFGQSVEAPEGKSFIYYFGGIDKARFKHVVTPGDQLQLKIKVLKRKRNVWKMLGEAFVGGELACSAELTCAVKEVSGD